MHGTTIATVANVFIFWTAIIACQKHLPAFLFVISDKEKFSHTFVSFFCLCAPPAQREVEIMPPPRQLAPLPGREHKPTGMLIYILYATK